MTIPISRRTALLGSLLVAPALLGPRALARALSDADAQASFAALERDNGGRLGVFILNVATGARVSHRADERFALCSTSKFLAAALVLTRVDRGEERLDRRVIFSADNLVAYSPATEKRVGEAGMTVAEICEAALTLSDNTAENLLLGSFGGPARLTDYARSLGDGLTRLDRTETALNEATPGDPRDTTTPAAMLENLRKIVLGDALSKTSREQLIAWMVANKTGDKRLRAGLPKDWRVGDKTGSGGHNTTNDIAVVWPPSGGPLIVTAYYAESPASDDQRNGVLAEVGRLAGRM